MEGFEVSYTRVVTSDEIAGAGLSHLLFGRRLEEDRATAGSADFSAESLTRWCLDLLEDAATLDVVGYGNVSLYESDQISTFLQTLDGTIAIDLTSLQHRVWAPVVKVLVESGMNFVALYAEPSDYRQSEEFPGATYDLSTSHGIEPLPGFARLSPRRDTDGHFAPLLGFEGARLAHIFDQEAVDAGRTSPVIGFPGFRIEYPTYTLIANRDVLEQGHMDQRIEYARASCPFEAYRAIERIHQRHSGKYLRISPIGTKPHALGAVLYSLRNPQLTELIYDHPVPSPGRTSGVRTQYLFEVGAFLNSLSSDG